MQETWVRSLDQEDPLDEGTVTHSSILAWKTPRTEKPVQLLAGGLLGVRQGGAEGKTNLQGGSSSGFHHPMRSSAARKPPQTVPNGAKEAGQYNLISVVIGHRRLPEREHHLG